MRYTWPVRMRGRAVALALAIGAHAGSAAAGGVVAITTDDPTCIAPEALARAISQRGGHATADATTRLSVRVRRRAPDVELEVAGESGGRALEPRSLVASSCAEALDAVALIAALAAEEAPVPPPSRSEPAPLRDAASPVPPAPENALYASFGWSGTTFASGTSGPRIALGRASSSPWFPWIEGSAAFSLPATESGGGGRATLSWLTARGAIGVAGVSVGSGGFASLYAAFDGGAIFATGADAPTVDSRSRPWCAMGAGARLRWTLGRLLVDASAGATVPLLRDDFVFVNGGTVYAVPAIAADGAIALGTHFP